MPMKESNEKLLVEFLLQEEMDSLIEEWDRYDADQSGVVTEAEFLKGESAWYERVYGEPISEADLKEKLQFHLRTRDQDGSGEVSWQEYSESKALLILDQRHALRSALSKEEEGDARDAFCRIDADGNGTISETEARKYFEARATIEVKNGLRTQREANSSVEKQVKNLFTFKDEDGSGTIDFDEFVNEEAKNIIADRYNEDKQSMVSDKLAGGGDEGPVDGNGAGSVLSEEQIEHARMKFLDWDKDGGGTLEASSI